MADYQALPDPNAFLRRADGVVVHFDPAGEDADWLAFAGWQEAGNVPDPLPGPTMADEARGLLERQQGVGIALTCTSAPALNGTYALDPTSVALIFQIGLFAAQFGVFPSGLATQAYADMAGVRHDFTVPQFVALLRVVAPLDGALKAQAKVLAEGGDATWPPQSVVIP